jgi:hypothetical protein
MRSPARTLVPSSTTHLMMDALVLPLEPALTRTMMSLFSADSSEPRSTMLTRSFSFLTVQVGPSNGLPTPRMMTMKKMAASEASARMPASQRYGANLRKTPGGDACGRDDGVVWPLELVDSLAGWVVGEFIDPHSSCIQRHEFQIEEQLRACNLVVYPSF